MEEEINLNPAFDHNSEYVCIEYPGLVVDKKKMLATLGGLKHLEEVYNDSTKRLDIRFRPDDPCCKPLCGDKISSPSLLLKVSKYRRKKKGNAPSNSDEEFKYQQTICGIVNSTYRFSTLCDYQYLSLRRNETTGKIENMIPHIKVNTSTIEEEGFFTKDLPLFLPPPTYGRLDTPHDYLYKKESVTFRRKPPTRHRKAAFYTKISLRKSRRNNCISVSYEDEVPTKCLPQALEVFEGVRGHIIEAKEKIIQCFEERPVWSKNALQVTLDYGAHFLKVLLPVVSYYVTTGPWARLWVRFGYDPKLDPSAREYQLVDFRLRQGLHSPYIPIKAKRSTLNYKLPHLTSKPYQTEKSVSSFAPNEGKSVDDTPGRSKKKITKASFIYQPGILPSHRQIFYQACDIYLPEARVLLCRSDPNITKCTKEDGWFIPNTQAEVRTLITADIYKTLSQKKDVTGATSRHLSTSNENPKELLKSTFDAEDESMQDEEDAADADESDDEEADDSDDSDQSDASKTASQDDFMDDDAADLEEDEASDDGSEGEDGELYFQDNEELDEDEQVLGAASLFGQEFPPL